MSLSLRPVFVYVIMSDCGAYCGICAVSLDVKWLEYGADHSHSSNVRVTMCEILFPCPLSAFMTCCLGTGMFYLSLTVDLWYAAVLSSNVNSFFFCRYVFGLYVFGLCCIEEFFNDRTFKECVCVCVRACVCVHVQERTCTFVCVCDIYITWCRFNVL
jgi:hypothetical protein